MHVTPPPPIGSVASDGGGLSAAAAGIGAAVQHRSGVPRLLGCREVAPRDCLSRVRGVSGPAAPPQSVAVPTLPAGSVGDGGDHLPGQQAAIDGVVPGHVAGDQPEERHQRVGLATCPGTGQLQDGLGAAAQTATRDGAAWARPAAWRRGGGRDVLGRRRSGGTRPMEWESAASGCGAFPIRAAGRCTGSSATPSNQAVP